MLPIDGETTGGPDRMTDPGAQKEPVLNFGGGGNAASCALKIE
jgi:hypothetical protein